MTFSIIWSENSLKQLHKLEPYIARRIVASVDKIKENPHNHVIKIVGSESFRLRIGDYRIIMDITSNEMKILILRVGHRKDIYKDL